MSYLVLARKWRPGRLDEVVGQAHVTQTLANAIEMDRVAHAFLFTGVRGVGKTSLARIMAKSLNCTSGPTIDPCGECESCRAIAGGTAVDVIEIDGASNNSVDDVRDLRDTVPYRPQLGKFKIYVIDEVHMLSTSAFNALLKTLEEPPPHVKFIFATTEPHKIPVTVLSRCQRYDFRRIPTGAIIDRISHILKNEGIEADATALHLIGREADGSMRDALSVLDQVLAAATGTITSEMVSDLLGMAGRSVYQELSGAILKSDPKKCLEIIRGVDNQGFDMTVFSRGLLEHLRNLVVLGVCDGDTSLVQLADQEAEDLKIQAQSVSVETLHRIFKHFSEAFEVISRSPYPRIMLETTLARIASFGEVVPAVELVRRLEQLTRSMASAGAPGSRPGGAEKGPFPPTAGAETAPASSSERSFAAPTMGSSAGPPPVAATQTSKRPSFVPPAGPPQTERSSEPPPPEKPSGPAKPLLSGPSWDKFIGNMRGTKPQLASMLECCVPDADNDTGRLSLVFSKDAAAAADIVRTPTRLRELADLVSNACNRPVQIEVRVGEAKGIPAVARRRMENEAKLRDAEDQARQHPLVRKAVAEFGGRITEIKVGSGNGDTD